MQDTTSSFDHTPDISTTNKSQIISKPFSNQKNFWTFFIMELNL